MVVAGVAESFELIPGQLETVLGAVLSGRRTLRP